MTTTPNEPVSDRDRTHTITDGSVRSTGPTDKSIDLGDRAMKSRLQKRMFGADATPPRIDRYRIERKLGAGGMGVVYEAHDEALERRVAIKLLHPDLDERHAIRMRREALALAKLSHPNVVHAYEIGTHEGSLFLVMELVDGEQLSKWQRAHRQQWKAIVAKYLEAGRGLAAAHAAGIVHRDFKPSNVVVCKDGSVRVLDFGLARSFGAIVEADESGVLSDASALDARVTVTGTTMGTPAYMSPEQMLGQPTNAASDQFSFCVALYEALYGERPFGGDTAAEVYESVLLERLRPVPKNSSVPTRLRRIVLRGLRPRPEQRHASMADVLRALEGSIGTGRWRPVMALGTLSLIGASWLIAAGEPACVDGNDAATARWNARRDAAVAAFSSSGIGYADATLSSVDARLQNYAKEWAEQRALACEIHDEAQRRRMLTCLDDHLASLDRLAAVLESGGAAVIEQALPLVDEVGAPSECWNAPTDSSRPDQQAELMSARLDAVAGRTDEARRKATTVLDAARTENARRLVGDSLFTLALVEIESGRHSEALGLLRAAAVEALAADAPLLASDAWLEAAYREAQDASTVERSREHSSNARALLESSSSDRLPGDREARLDWIEGLQDLATEDAAGALPKLRRAVTGLEQAHDPQHRVVTRARLDLAHALAVTGNSSEALETYDATRSLMADLVGARHPGLWAFDYGIALVHLDLGEIENARARLEQALAVLTDEGSAWAEPRGQVLVALAEAHRLSGNDEEALQAARDAKAAVAELPSDHVLRLHADVTLAILLHKKGDLDGAAEAFRAVAAGHEVAKNQRSAAEVRAQLVTIELRRGRAVDAASILERHRGAVSDRFGEAMTGALEDAVAGLRALANSDAEAARAHLERVRIELSPEGEDMVRWCDLRAWATIELAKSFADDDPARAKALAVEAREHLEASHHDAALLADAEALAQN